MFTIQNIAFPGPPSPEQVKFAESPGLTVSLVGVTVTPPAGDTIQNQ